MGYESKVYIVHKNLIPDEGWADEIACFKMGKMGYESEYHKLFKNSKETDCYIYADDGNTKILEDACGDKLREMRIENLIEALEKDNDGYWRIPPLLSFLKALQKKEIKNIVALHFGY